MRITVYDSERLHTLRFRYSAKEKICLVFRFYKPDGTLLSEEKYDYETLKKYSDPHYISKFPDIDRGSHLIRIRGVYDDGIYFSLFERSGECAWRTLCDYRLDEQEPKVEKEEMLINLAKVVGLFSVDVIKE